MEYGLLKQQASLSLFFLSKHMTNPHLRADIDTYPDLFWFQSPLTASESHRAIELWKPPNDLLDIWQQFGGGEMFESEKILRPFAESASVDFITAREQKKGFSKNLIVFHIGIFISAFGAEGFEVFDSDSFKSFGKFKSLDTWYVEMIRGSFEQRYGLAKI